MKTMIAGLAFAFTIAATAATAQPVAFPANEMGVTMGHWHLNSKDAAVNKQFFVTLGGRVVKRGENVVVLFPGVVIFLTRGQGVVPTGGTAGTVVNHVGFVVRNVQESLAKWKAAGIQVEPSATGRPRSEGTPTTKPTSASMSRRTDGPNTGAASAGALRCPDGRTTSVPDTTTVPDRPW